jgi:hypothetical protein
MYEAGPPGSGLHRVFTAAGIQSEVAGVVEAEEPSLG